MEPRRQVGSVALLALVLASAPGIAGASFESPGPGEVVVRDAPGTHREWQEGRTIVDAPAAVVRDWLLDASRWTERFRDDVAVTVLERQSGFERVRLRSRIAGRELVVDVRPTERGIWSTGHDHGLSTETYLYITPLGRGRTDVVMQTYARLHGLTGVLAPANTVRDRMRRKLFWDLTDLQRLAARRSLVGQR